MIKEEMYEDDPHHYTRGLLVYKCRYCGKEFEYRREDNLTGALLKVTYIIQNDHAEVLLLRTHVCSKDKIGLADLIGGNYSNPT